MEANKNRFIEDWSSARENSEHNFRWTRRNLALVGLFGLAVPILVYKGIVREFFRRTQAYIIYGNCYSGLPVNSFSLLTCFVNCGYKHMQDEDAGRPYRKFL